MIDNPYGGAFRSNRRPSVVPGVDPFLSTGDKRFFLNPAAFTFPQPGQFGNLGRYALHGPGLSQFDFTLHKRVRDRREAQPGIPGGVLQPLQPREFRESAGRSGDGIGNGREPASAGPAVFSGDRGRGIRRVQLDGQQGCRARRAAADSVLASSELLSSGRWSTGEAVLSKECRFPLFHSDDAKLLRRAGTLLGRLPEIARPPHPPAAHTRSARPPRSRSRRRRSCASGASRSTARAAEFPRIFVHELFHFVWLRAGNPLRWSYEGCVRAEFRSGARGELGWSAEWRKAASRAGDVRRRSRRWREYACESFCDTAAWLYSGVDSPSRVHTCDALPQSQTKLVSNRNWSGARLSI